VTLSKTSYPKEFRERVTLEAIESGNIKATSAKYEIKPTTLYSWVKAFNNKDIIKRNKTLTQMQKELDEKDLEIRILKELLKKTTLTLIKD
jgi:transposase-like protein